MKRMFIAGVVAALVVIGGVVVWATYLRDDAPAAFELTGNGEAADSGDGTDGTPSGGPVDLEGTWTVAEGSEAGYRVIEDLGELLDLEAVGRTSEVTGSLEISGTAVASASFEVDVASISSDDSRRDTQFRDRIMNASEFPTATLTLTGPIDLGTLPADGETVSTTAEAQLTLRGVTNPVSVSIEAQLAGDQIEIVGSVDVLFSDYGIDNPSNPLVEVRDEGKVEVQLFLSAS